MARRSACYAASMIMPLVFIACTDRVAGLTDSATAGSSGDPTTGTTTTPTTTAAACVDYSYIPVFPTTLSAMVMLDRSPAMLDPWDHDGDPQTPDQSRWASVRNALLTVLPQQPAAFGLAPFPTSDAQDSEDASACTVTPALFVPTSGAPAAEVFTGLPPAAPAPGSFVGGSPTRAALAAAVSLPDGAASENRILIVMANSAASCDPDAKDAAARLETYDSGALAAATSALDAGVRVFVYGIGAATEASPVLVDHRPDNVIVSDTLADLALAGGGSYFNATSEAQLIAELAASFETEGVSCLFTLSPEPGPDQAVTGVRVDGKDFPKVGDCQAEDGWRLAGDEVELCGEACTQFRATFAVEFFVTCF